MDNALLKSKVDEYARWDNLMAEAKKEIEKLKAEFQKLGVEALQDKKVKQVEFWGSNHNKVVVTTSESLKLVSYHYLLKLIGQDLLKDFIKIEPQYKLSDPFKRLMTAIFQGHYVEQSTDDVISQISDDEKIQNTLKKKLRGNWDKDVNHLRNIAGLNQKDAEHFAYFIQEAKNYEKIVHLLEAAGHQQSSEAFKTALDSICHAVIVEEGIKVGIEGDAGG